MVADIKVSSAAFDSYRVKPMETGINLRKLSTFLDLVGRDAVIDFTITEAKRVVLSTDCFTYMFSLIDPETITRPFDDDNVEHSGEVALPSPKLTASIKFAEPAGSQITFSIDDDNTMFWGWVSTPWDLFHFESGLTTSALSTSTKPDS